MKVLRVISALIAMISVGAAYARAQETGSELSVDVARKFYSQWNAYPQEKIYIHTDRDHYISGDTIWLRAHVVNAMTHVPATVSRFVYADLINPAGEVAWNIKIMIRDGVYSGYIPLVETAPSGTYTLRAYTNFMKNVGQEYMPLKRIRVSDKAMMDIPARMEFIHRGNGRIRGELTIQDLRKGYSIDGESIYITVNGKFIDMREVGSRGQLAFSAKLEDPRAKNVVSVEYSDFTRFFTIPAADDDFDVSFFPEGGYMIDGAACTVGFKALRKDGTSVDVSGRIVDEEGNEAAMFESTHKGMGTFILLPYKDVKYYAECSGPAGDTLRFELPQVRGDAVVLRLKHIADYMWIETVSPDGFTLGKPLYIVMHSRGNPVLVRALTDQGHVLKLDRRDLPSGVLHVLLVDSDFNVLSERLTFISNDDQAYSTVTVDRESYGKREPVEVTATVTDAAGNPLRGRFSVAVTDDSMAEADNTSNILTELLLASDLRGLIEDPVWYFTPGNDDAGWGLEALMLTQGWRRYDVPKLLKGDYQTPKEYLELGDYVSGKVITLFRQNPINNAEVTLLFKELGYLDRTETDKDGEFMLDGFDIPEGASIWLQALSDKGKKRVELIVDKPERLPVDPTLLISDRPTNSHESEAQADTAFLQRVITRRSDWSLDDVITIDEVVVTVKAPGQGFYSGQFMMGKTYDEKYLNRIGQDNMWSLLMRLAPFISIFGDSVSYKNKPVRIIFDNWDVEQVHLGLFLSMSTEGLICVERALDEETLPFGFDFTNGGPTYGAVFAFYSKGGMGMHNMVDRRFNVKVVNPLGFQKAVEFYSPAYESGEGTDIAHNDRRITLYWQPDLRTDEDGKATFNFHTSDILPTNYSIVIEGVTDDGKVVRSTGTVKVVADSGRWPR